MSALSLPATHVTLGKAFVYNSRAKASSNIVTEIVGKTEIIQEFIKHIQYVEDFSEDSLPYIYFQTCLTQKISKQAPKPVEYINVKRWGKFSDPVHDGISWHTVYASTEALARLIQHGFITRLGIKEGGNSLQNFVGANGIQLDLDQDESITCEQTVEILQDAGIQPFAVYYSPSGNPINNRMRAVILFNRLETDYNRLSNYIKAVNSLLPNAANNVCDPARLFYSTLLPIPYLRCDALNDFNETYQVIVPINAGNATVTENDSGSNTLLESSDRQTANRQFVDHLKTYVLSDRSVFDLVAEWCEYHQHPIEGWHRHSSPGENLEQWRGRDPIDPEGSRTGTSFTVCHLPNDTFVYRSGRSGVDGDLPDLWYRLSIGDWQPGIRDKSLWWNAVREICEYHKIPDFSVVWSRKQLEKKAKHLESLESCVDQTKLGKGVIALLPHKVWGLFCKSREGSFYYQESSKRYWLYDSERTLWISCGKEGFYSKLRDFLMGFGSVYGVAVEDLLTASFLQGLMTCVKSIPECHVVEDFQYSYDYVPCANGAYSLVDRKLVPYSATIRNSCKLPFNYSPSSGKGYKAFKDLLEYIVVDPECVSDVLKWIAATVQYKGFYTRKALSLIGDPNSGKTFLTNLIKSLVQASQDVSYPTLAKELKAGTLLDERSRFSTIQLKGVVLGVFTEFNGLPHNSDGSLLKDLIANPTDDPNGISVAAEYKGGEHVDIKVRAAIITNGQSFPKLPANDNGWDRRIMPVIVRHNPVRNDSVFSNAKEHLEDFFSWCLEQDVSEIIRHFKKMSDDQYHLSPDYWLGRAIRQMKIANNRYWRFVEDVLIIDQDSKVSSVEVFRKFQEWCLHNEEKSGSKRIFDENLATAIADMTKRSPSQVLVKEPNGVLYYYGVQININAL
jgi:phage/plasmid-associated DNA primase